MTRHVAKGPSRREAGHEVRGKLQRESRRNRFSDFVLYYFVTTGQHWPALIGKVANILRGSVETHFTCGGIFDADFIAHLLMMDEF